MKNKKNQKINPEIKIINSNKYIKIFIIYSCLSFFTIIFTLIFLFIFRSVPYSFHGHNIDEFTNDYCQNKTNQYYDLLCTNKYYKYNFKKSKFIWILTDGTASDQLNLLSNHEKYKIASSFLVEGNDVTYKHTNSLHEELITGKINKNFNGKEINFDNILKQLVNAGYKINYRGWDTPIPKIVGDKEKGINENKIFNKKFIDNAHEVTAFSSFCNITNPFPFLYLSYDKYQNPTPNNAVNGELLNKIKQIINNKDTYLYNKESRLELYEELDDLFEQYPIDLFTINIDDCLKKSFDWNENENISILYYTTEIDHFNHVFGKTYIYSILQVYITEKMIERIIKWIDEHEDYVLIVTSDHGGQEFYGEDVLINHGGDIPGNEAIFFVYTKELKDHYDELKMRERYIYIADEGEMISQILSNVNIPITSQGFPLKLIKDVINSFIALKMKEIQLIKLMEKYIQKYKGYKNSLKDILNKLQINFSQTDLIINKYIGEDLNIKSENVREFEKYIKNYEKSLNSTQEDIIKKIKRKNKTTKNIILFVAIFIIIFFKFFFEIYIIFFKIFDFESAGIKNKKCYVLILGVLFIIFIFIFYALVIGDNLRNSILNYCFIYGLYISLLLIYLNYLIFKLDNNNKANILICSIFLYVMFIKLVYYSNCFYYFKKNILYYRKIWNICTNLIIFLQLICFIIFFKHVKYRQKKYAFWIFKKTFNICIIDMIYLILAITIFIEDCTRKSYYGQNLSNKKFVLINFIIFIFLLIFSNFPIYEDTNKQENKNDNTNEINKLKVNEDFYKAFKGNDINYKNEFLNEKRVDGLPNIKLFLLLLFLWISDEGQKLYGFLILLPFLELMNYLSNYFKSKIDEIINEKKVNNFDIPCFRKNKYKVYRKKNNNLYIYYFINYFVVQEMFIIANLSSFVMMQNSLGLELDHIQQGKVLYVLKFLKFFFRLMTKYRYILITLGFYLENNVYDKVMNKKDFSLDFFMRKLILGLRIDLDILYVFYQTLININDRLFIDLYTYSFVNISLFILDYFGFLIYKINKKIC